jgi:hypothetical protein
MFADHFSGATKLFQTADAKLTSPAMSQIMYTDAIAGRDMPDIGADFFDPTCDFVPERYRQTVNPGNPGAIMFVRMADPARRNSNQNVGRTDFWKVNLLFLQPFSDLSQSHCSHSLQCYAGFECTLESKSACTWPSNPRW